MQTLPLEQIVLAAPRGFCAGVERAISIVEQALQRYGRPIYVKHAIVHNTHVVERLEAQGAIFVEELSDLPEGATVIFSAHGSAPQVYQQARQAHLEVIDATCPLVTKVHKEALRYSKEGRTIFLIGHRDHVEVTGTHGQAPHHIKIVGSAEEARQVDADNPQRVAYLTQTTLSVDDTESIASVLRHRFPALVSPRKDDICYATQNRQHAVRTMAEIADLILVLGSKHSSNSRRLVEVAHKKGVAAYLINAFSELDWNWLKTVRIIGITAGASAPEDLVQALVTGLQQRSHAQVRELQVTEEQVHFPLPRQLAEHRERHSENVAP